jgi:hypothetical protein
MRGWDPCGRPGEGWWPNNACELDAYVRTLAVALGRGSRPVRIASPLALPAPTQRLVVHSRGDGLSSPWGGVLA